ncbi:MAG: rod shape-determining protein RodA [Prevotellaceae bacterium]|nr:rod shape-determining protein RodA [Candidatus Colivivens equi]
MTSTQNSKRIFLSVDWIAVGLWAILLIWGWFSVCGACYDFSSPDLLSWNSNSGKQLVWIFSSVILAGTLLLIEKKFYCDISKTLYITMMILLLLTAFIAPDTKGSRSWLPLGPVKLQPAELAKFTVALAMAKVMDRYGFNIHNRHDFLQVLGIVVLPIFLILMEKETGSALVYMALFFVMYREGMTGAVLFATFACVAYFVVGIKFGGDYITNMPTSVGEFWVLLLAYLFTLGLVIIYCKDRIVIKNLIVYGGRVQLCAWLFSAYVIPFNVCIIQLIVNISMILYLGYMALATRYNKYAFITLFACISVVTYYLCDYVFDNVLRDHQRVRIEVLLGTKDDPRGAGYNVNQAKIAIGSGGFAGKGFLKGTQTKLKYVPEQDTDFIFCTVGEENGFIGCLGVLTLYLFLIIRLFVLAERQPDTLGRVYGYSVGCVLLFHLFVNVGMVLGLTPVIGIPLPFFSYGGSSLWGFTILLFIFLRMDAEYRSHQLNG